MVLKFLFFDLLYFFIDKFMKFAFLFTSIGALYRFLIMTVVLVSGAIAAAMLIFLLISAAVAFASTIS